MPAKSAMLTAGQYQSNPLTISGTTKTLFELFSYAVALDVQLRIDNPGSNGALYVVLARRRVLEPLFNGKHNLII